MDEYKSINPSSFFDSLNDNRRTLLTSYEKEEEKLQLDHEILNSFLSELPDYANFLKEYQSLDEENVSMSINAFDKFARYNPKETIFKVLIDSNALDGLIKYASNDIDNNFSNPIFKANIVKIFNIFAEISKANDHTILLEMIRRGILRLCFHNCFFTDDDINKNINFILNSFLSSSFFICSLVYSTGILQKFNSSAEEDTEGIPNVIVRFISALVQKFVYMNKTIGPVNPELEEVRRIVDENSQQWDDFMQNYYEETIFEKSLFNDFVLNGIVFTTGSIFYDIISNLIELDDDLCVINGLKSLYYLVSRDCNNINDHKICNDIIISNKIPFLSLFEKYIKGGCIEIIEIALQILALANNPDSKDAHFQLNLNEYAKIIIDFITNTNEDEIKFEFNEKILCYVCHALNNIIMNVNNFTYVEDENDCEKLMLFIYQCLRQGSYKNRKAVLYFYLSLACGYLENKIVYKSIFENMVEIKSIAEVNANIDLNIQILKSLKYIFLIEEEKLKNRNLYEKFISPSVDGYKMVFEFAKDESNPDLAKKARKFIEKTYDEYAVELDSELEFDPSALNEEEDNDPSDFFYKGMKF